MVDAVTPNTSSSISGSQRKQPSSSVSAKTNQFFAQAVLNLPSSSVVAKTTNITQQGSKPLGFSTNLPRGSLVDKLV